MKRIYLFAISLFLVTLVPGVSAQNNHRLAIVDEKLNRLQAEIEAIQFQQKKMQEQITDLREDLATLRETDRAGVSTGEWQALEARIKELDAQRAKDRQWILDKLSKEMAAIVGGGTVGESGIVHQVAKGETLGAIAGHYGVTVADLVKLNQITNPDAIRIGQELVIPK